MEQVLSIAIFLGFGLGFVLVNLLVGALVRPSLPNSEKVAIYECGEPTIGTSWVQFDLRFYIVALFYLVFDVEVALIYPWAVVYREYPGPALALGLPFLAVVVIGYAYEWYSGSLEWVRSSATTSLRAAAEEAVTANKPAAIPGTPGYDAAGISLRDLARRDPEALEDQRAATVPSGAFGFPGPAKSE